MRLGDDFEINIGKAQAKGEGLRFSVLGKSGSGKTNTLFVIAEEMLAAGFPLLVIDPMNCFRHLRSLPYPVIVAGPRPSADVRLTLDNAPALAEWFFKERVSLVIDTGMYEPGQDVEIVAAFLERFWRLILTQDEDTALQPYAILLDEAHEFIPQGKGTQAATILKDIGKRGRQMNVWVFTATQRAASMDKNFLTQVNGIIALRVSLGLDTAVVAAGMSASEKTIVGIMRKLETGQALVIGDSELIDCGDEDYKIAQVRQTNVVYTRKAVTADDEAAPSARVIDASTLEALRSAMDVPEQSIRLAPAEEIIRLKRRVAELEAERDALRGNEQPIAMHQPARVVQANGFHTARRSVFILPTAPEPPPQQMPLVPTNGGSVRLNDGCLRILNRLADIYPMKVTRAQIAALVGYTVTGGTFLTNWGVLKRARYVSEAANWDVWITPQGFAHLGRELPKQPQTHETIMDMWRGVLQLREWEILQRLVEVHPGWLQKAQLAAMVGMAFSGGAFNGYIGNLHRNGLIEKHGADVRAKAATLLLGEHYA